MLHLLSVDMYSRDYITDTNFLLTGGKINLRGHKVINRLEKKKTFLQVKIEKLYIFLLFYRLHNAQKINQQAPDN